MSYKLLSVWGLFVLGWMDIITGIVWFFNLGLLWQQHRESGTYGTFTNVWSSPIMYRHGFGNHHIHRTGNLIRQLSSLVVASGGRGAPIKLFKEDTAGSSSFFTVALLTRYIRSWLRTLSRCWLVIKQGKGIHALKLWKLWWWKPALRMGSNIFESY